MMAENDIPGYRFNPFDRELITEFLKPKIMGTTLRCNMIKEKQVYGSSLSLNPWRVFDTNDSDSWFRWPGLKETEKCTFAFVRLCKISKSSTGTGKNTSKKAGCGTWAGKGKQDQIVDFEGKVIGEKKYLVFEINDIGSAGLDLSQIGQYKMHEFSLIGDDADLNSAANMVLCRITYDSSKECPINLKPGTKSANHVSSSSSEAQIKEENNNNFEGAGIAKVENLTLLDSGVSVGLKLEESGTSTAQNLAVVDSGVGGNLEGSRSLTSECLVTINSDVSEPFAAGQYNNALQELNNFGKGFGFDDLGGLDFSFDGPDDCYFMACLDPIIQEEPSRDIQDSGVSFGEKLEESGTSTVQNLAVVDSGVGGNLEGSRSLTSESLVAINIDVSEPFAAAQYNNGFQELNNFGEGFGFDDLGGLDLCLDGPDDCYFMACLDPIIQEEPSQDIQDSGVSFGEKIEESGTSTVQNLAVVDSGVGGNLEGSRSLTSESLVAINSDVSEPFAAAQYNNGLQELNNFGEGFGFDDLGGLDLCVDGLDVCDFVACLDPNIQEEPSRDSSGRKLKREFEYEENLYQSKKMRLANPN